MSQRPQAELAPAPRSRLFFALWPDATQRGELYRLARRLHSGCGGRVTRRDKLHLTLVFLGNIEHEKIPQLEALAARLRVPRFDLEFGATGYWRHNRIVWAAPVAIPQRLAELVAALEGTLENAGYRFDRRPYAPHITLIRDAHEPGELPRFSTRWEISEFALVQSTRDDQGSRYQVVARWPLAADVN
jgi:RNA 2',3'-cyclic 3'-phosphodiesterase